MKEPHNTEHKAWLRAIAVGDEGRSGATWEALRNCPVCRDEIEEGVAIEDILRETAGEEDAVLRASAALTRAPGEEIVERFIAQELTAIEGGRGAAPLWIFAAAAAVLLLGGLYWWGPAREPAPGSPESPRSIVLGPEQADALSPAGRVDSYDVPFRWTLESEGWFRVWAAEAEPGAPALSTSPRLEAPQWRWPAEERERWPDAIRWEVMAYDLTGIAFDSIDAEVTLPDGG